MSSNWKSHPETSAYISLINVIKETNNKTSTGDTAARD